MNKYIRWLKCLFGYHDFIPCLKWKLEYKRGASWYSNNRTKYHWVEKQKIKYYYCEHCRKRISVTKYKELTQNQQYDKRRNNIPNYLRLVQSLE